MADYPDGMQHVNIAAQDIAELTQRPKYGALTLAYFTGLISAVSMVTLYTISGKGMIYGGFVFSASTIASHSSDGIYCIVDGFALQAFSFLDQNNREFNSNWTDMMYIKKFDDINWKYSLCFSHGITFESQIQIKYYNSQVSNTAVESYLYFSAI